MPKAYLLLEIGLTTVYATNQRVTYINKKRKYLSIIVFFEGAYYFIYGIIFKKDYGIVRKLLKF